MKTDSLLYRIFQELPSTFFELIGKTASEAEAYRFESVEIKQTSFRIDGVFSPKSARSKRPLYFGEFQFYKNQNLYCGTGGAGCRFDGRGGAKSS